MLQIEPNVKCESGIICFRDASTDYGLINQRLWKTLSSLVVRHRLKTNLDQFTSTRAQIQIEK